MAFMVFAGPIQTFVRAQCKRLTTFSSALNEPGSATVEKVLRWYWRRLKGWGYAAGFFSGMVLLLRSSAIRLRGANPCHFTSASRVT
jgi:hypothetical protein